MVTFQASGRKAAIFFALSFSAPSLFGQSFSDGCSAVDLRASMGQVRDQGTSGWCYAHTTADLITQKTGIRASAFDIATTFLLGDPRKILSSKQSSIRKYLTLHPEFRERLLRERLRGDDYSSKSLQTAKGLLAMGGAEDLALMMVNSKGLCAERRLPDVLENSTRYLQNLLQIRKYTSELTPRRRRNLGEDVAYLTHIHERDAREKAGAFQEWVNLQCGTRQRLSAALTPGQYYIAETPEEFGELPLDVRRERQTALKQLIGEQLSDKRAVAIGFDANDLMEPDEDGMPADHSAVVAARRLRAGKCEYYVRLTFGDHCGDFLPQVQGSCEHGGLWVALEDIPSLYSAVWIQ